MNKNEDYLKNKFGKECPFTVPEGYFDKLSSDIMAKMPGNSVPQMPEPEANADNDTNTQRKKIFVKLRPYLYLAALFAGLYFGINVMKYQENVKKAQVTHQASYDEYDKYLDDVCDYADISKEEIYAYAHAYDQDDVD
jgi:hypothetical protein